MTDNWRMLRGYAACALAYAVCLVFSGGDEAAAKTSFVVVMAVALLLGWLATQWLKERHLRVLRQHAREDRRTLVTWILDDAYRDTITNRLAEDENANTSTEYVEAFVFPPELRRQAARLLVIAWAGALLFVVVGLVGPSNRRWDDAIPILAGAMALAAAFLLSKRVRHLETVLEVSNFGVAEVRGNARRVIPWNRALLLRNKPLFRRFELIAVGANGVIRIDYSRLEFFRLLEVVIERGGFRPKPVGPCGRTSSSTPPQPDAAWLAERSAANLAQVLRSVRLDVRRQGRTVNAAGHRIEVDAHVEVIARQGEQHIVGANFQVTIDGEVVTALQGGAIGIDSTLEGARATAASEWASQYGAPIGWAIARWVGVTTTPQQRDAVSDFDLNVRVGGELLHYGAPGFRGRSTDPGGLSSDEFVQNIAARALPLMGSSNHFRSATILLEFNGDAVVGGECRVNGTVSPALLDDLKGITLPKQEPRFLYRLFLAAAPRTN